MTAQPESTAVVAASSPAARTSLLLVLAARAWHMVSTALSAEVFFALFLVAGVYKGDTRLHFIERFVDLTVLTWLLSLIFTTAWVVRLRGRTMVSPSFPWIMALFLGLAASVTIGMLHTPASTAALEKFGRFLAFTAWAFVGGAVLVGRPRFVTRFCFVFLILAILMAVDGTFRWIHMDTPGFVTSLGATQTSYGRISGTGLIMVIGLALPSSRLLSRVALWGLAGWLLWGLFVAGVRGPLLSCSVALAVLAILGMRWSAPGRLQFDRVAATVMNLAGAGVIATIFFTARGWTTVMFHRLALLTSSGGDSVWQRLDFLRVALERWNESLWLGIGTAGFGILYYGQNTRAYPHNLLVEIGSENGLLGLTALSALFAGCLYCAWRACRGPLEAGTVAPRMFLAAAIFHIMNAMVSGDLNDGRVMFAFLGIAASAEAVGRSAASRRKPSESAPVIAAA